MGVLDWNQLTMQLFVFLATVATVFGAPAPQDEDAPVAVPYVHEDIAAEPYVHIEPENTVEEIPAEPYVHEEPVETHDIVAEPYVHEDIEAEAYVHEEPVPAAAPVLTYAFPYATHAYTIPVAAAPVATKTEAAAPVAYAYAAPYAYAVPHTGCVNSVGSVVPCAV